MRCIELSNAPKTSTSMTKWRQMATALALGNKIEAERIYDRSVELGDKQLTKLQSQQLSVLAGLSVRDDHFHQWCWKDKNHKSNDLQSVITDMLIVDHFAEVNTAASSENKNTSKKETA